MTSGGARACAHTSPRLWTSDVLSATSVSVRNLAVAGGGAVGYGGDGVVTIKARRVISSPPSAASQLYPRTMKENSVSACRRRANIHLGEEACVRRRKDRGLCRAGALGGTGTVRKKTLLASCG